MGSLLAKDYNSITLRKFNLLLLNNTEMRNSENYFTSPGKNVC